MGVYYESRNPTFTELPLPQKQPGPLPLPHGMGKWDANLPNSQNSNIARFISFSTLVALKREKGGKSKINRTWEWGRRGGDKYFSSRGVKLVWTPGVWFWAAGSAGRAESRSRALT